MKQTYRRKLNEAAKAQAAGQDESQWLDAQIKKAESQSERDAARAAAKLVWNS